MKPSHLIIICLSLVALFGSLSYQHRRAEQQTRQTTALLEQQHAQQMKELKAAHADQMRQQQTYIQTVIRFLDNRAQSRIRREKIIQESGNDPKVIAQLDAVPALSLPQPPPGIEPLILPP